MFNRFQVPRIDSSEITPENVYLRRREFMQRCCRLGCGTRFGSLNQTLANLLSTFCCLRCYSPGVSAELYLNDGMLAFLPLSFLPFNTFSYGRCECFLRRFRGEIRASKYMCESACRGRIHAYNALLGWGTPRPFFHVLAI